LSTGPVLDRLGRAVEALASLGDTGKPADARENLEEYFFTRNVQANALSGLGDPLAKLNEAGFGLALKVQAGGYEGSLALQSMPGGLGASVTKGRDLDDPLPDLSEEALAALDDLSALLAPGSSPAFPDLTVQIGKVAGLGVPVQATLTVSLRKTSVNTEIETGGSSREAHVMLFLSPLRLAGILETTSLTDLEEQFFTAGSRTVFVVPGVKGSLAGDLLGAFGSDSAAELDAYLAKGLPPEAKRRAEEAHGFCDWQCDWPERPQWLTPETFSTDLSGGADAGRTALEERFGRLRSLLCILFLARRTRRDGAGSYEVNFGQSPGDAFAFMPADVTAPSEESSDRLFALYKFSYDGSFAEKLELVRQFLAPHVQDLASLFRNTRMALQASQKAHERYLTKKVDEYFEAQRKSREYIQEAVRDGEKSIMDMSQEVAESVYKTFGAVALVVVAQALDTKVSAPAGLVAAVVLTVYLMAVVFFYLPSVEKAQQVRQDQFTDHIESFRPVLTEDEVTELLENERVQQAWNDFETKRTWAFRIYVALLVLSAAAMGFYLWQVVF
jgi:hypothetical protein